MDVLCLAHFGALYKVSYYDAGHVYDTISSTESETTNTQIKLTDNFEYMAKKLTTKLNFPWRCHHLDNVLEFFQGSGALMTIATIHVIIEG